MCPCTSDDFANNIYYYVAPSTLENFCLCFCAYQMQNFFV